MFHARAGFFVAVTLLSSLALLLPAGGEESRSPYTGYQGRDIKALDPSEVEGLETGRGLGMALPAELNGYPGPMHVLELADDLELTPDQKSRTEASYQEMKQEAVRLGQGIVAHERDLDRLFASGGASEKEVRSIAGKIGKLRGQLRFAHLKAHLEMKAILDPRQVRRYSELRGYGSPD